MQRLYIDIMISKDIQQIIPVIRQYLSKQPVKRAYLFGSCSRGEETPNSDIDILVNLDYSQPIGLLKYVAIMNGLSQQIGKKVDMVEEEGLASFAKPYVDNDKILIYERAN